MPSTSDKKQAFEWVLIMSKGDDVSLTEKQYEHYKDNWKDGKIFFDTFEVNPSFVVSAKQYPASDELKKKYPCKTCHTNGYLIERDREGNFKICPTCEGTGMEL
jgi:hypothetical protein